MRKVRFKTRFKFSEFLLLEKKKVLEHGSPLLEVGLECFRLQNIVFDSVTPMNRVRMISDANSGIITTLCSE